MNRKRLLRKVSLVFFQDDANGEWGLTHKQTQRNDDGFNAFWDGRGLFHDVWEHHHEHTRFFQGEFAHNIGGEMAAMGALWYLYESLGVHTRLDTSYHAPDDMMRETTLSLVQEAISEGYTQFGNTLQSNVPTQKEVDNSALEWQIEEFMSKVRGYAPSGTGEREVESGNAYKQSVTLEKVANLHRWGYRMAERQIPHNWENQNTLIQFIQFWDTFCKRHSAEEMALSYKGVDFSIYRQGENISWRADFIKRPYDEETKDLSIRSENVA